MHQAAVCYMMRMRQQEPDTPPLVQLQQQALIFVPCSLEAHEKHRMKKTQAECATFKVYAESFDCLLDRHLNGIPHPCFAQGALLYMRADYFMGKGN